MKENIKFIAARGIVAALVLSHFSLQTSAYYIVDTFEAIVTPYGLWMSPNNILYASSPSSVSKISGSAPTTVIAGGGSLVGDGGPATSAQLSGSYGIKGDSSGNIFICERDNYSIRKMNLASGIISTVAGGSNTGNNGGDNGPATSANLGMPMSIAFDTSGNMYLADFSFGVLRKIDVNGIITTFLGDENLLFSSDVNGPRTSASMAPSKSIFIHDEKLFMSTQNCHVQVIDLVTDMVSTIAGGVCEPTAQNSDDSAQFVGSGNDVRATSAYLENPQITVDTLGNLFLYETSYTVRQVDLNGMIFAIAGQLDMAGSGVDTGHATSALMNQLDELCGITTDTAGVIYFSNPDKDIIRRLSQGSDPSAAPSVEPSVTPSLTPSAVPSHAPSVVPSIVPTAVPSIVPSAGLTVEPSAVPSVLPTAVPSLAPFVMATVEPSALPSIVPSIVPSAVPSIAPSAELTVEPSTVPSIVPTVVPSIAPSAELTVEPSAAPSIVPSGEPSIAPSTEPSVEPSTLPSVTPSATPTLFTALGESPKDGDDLSTGQFSGVVIGVVVAALLIGALVWCCVYSMPCGAIASDDRRDKKAEQEKGVDMHQPSGAIARDNDRDLNV